MARRFLVLTAKRIAALAPGKQAQENGIIVTRLRNGDLRWSINTMVDGERIHRVIGTESTGVSRQTAEEAIEKLCTDARAQRLSLPCRRKTPKKFSDASSDYLDRLRREDGKNLVQKEIHLRLHLVPKLGNLPINKITEERLASYRRQRRDEGAEDTTINRELSTISQFFRLASSRKWRWMSSDDVPEIKCTPEPKLPFKVLSKEELQRLRVAAAELGEQQLLFVEMMSGSAMRPSEVLRARLEHVQDDRDELAIPKAKAGARVQPITTALARMLREARQRRLENSGKAAGWLFPSPHRKARKDKHRTSYLPMFKKIVEHAELDAHQVTPYTLKRTSITDAAATRIDLNGLMQISGHKSVTSVLRYIQTRDEEIRRTMDALEQRGVTPDLHTQ